MITQVLSAFCLVALTVMIHAAGLAIALSHVLHYSVRPETRFWPITWLLIRIAWWLIFVHISRDCCLGFVFLVAGMSARCRILLLLLRRYVRDTRLL
jgi:hypothetical protein